jgi:glycosyltransferase involved in cell wall biosynthesis
VRLAIVTHNVIRGNGQGRANYEIARYMLAHGHQVTLFSEQVDPVIIEAGAEWEFIPSKLKKIGLLQIWETGQRADRALRRRRGDFDVIHAYGYTTGEAHDINTAQFVHSAWIANPSHTSRVSRNAYGAYQWLYSALNSRWEKSAFARARQLTACAEIVREELMALGIPGEKIQTIPNGVDLDEFQPGVEDRAALGLPVGVPLALFAGDIRTPRKNLDTVLRALVKAEGVHLAVVGTVQGSPYPQMAADLGLTSRVHFLDFRKDIARIMRASDVFVFPSRYEPFGMVVIEAMACGIPVITARSTGAAEAVTPESGAVMADSEDADGIAEALNTIAADPARAHAMGGAARAVAEGYGWEGIAAQYLRLYEMLASTKKGSKSA